MSLLSLLGARILRKLTGQRSRERLIFLVSVSTIGMAGLLLLYRFLYFLVLKSTFSEYEHLSLLDYFALCSITDLKILPWVFLTFLLSFLVLSRFQRVAYFVCAIYLQLLAAAFVVSLAYLQIFETNFQLDSIRAGLGGFWHAILYSAMFEVPVYHVIILFSLLASIGIVAARGYARDKRMSRLLGKKIRLAQASFSVFLVFFIIQYSCSAPADAKQAVVGENRNIKYPLTPREISDNPIHIFYRYLAPGAKENEGAKNVANNNARRSSGLRDNEIKRGDKRDEQEFRFGLNSDSLISTKKFPRLPIPRGKQYNIVLYFFESTCRHYVGQKINGRRVTPVWDRLARNSFVANNHYTHNPLSIHSRVTVLSSSYEPPVDGWVASLYPGIKIKSLPEILRERDYRSALYTSNSLKNFDNIRYLKGRGFAEIKDFDDFRKNKKYKQVMSWAVDDRELIEPAVEFAKQERKKPFFMVFQPSTPHHPYIIPDKKYEIIKPRGNQKQIRWARYVNSLHFSDSVVGRLLERMEAEGLMENTLFFLFADHGEAFFQHKSNYLHALFLNEENVHIPFLIYNKKLFPGSYQYTGISRHIDVLPTILDALGLNREIRPEHEGQSLFASHRQKLAYLHTRWTRDYIGLRDDKWKYMYRVEDRKEELFDVSVDKWEKNNLAERRPEIARKFREYVLNARKYKKRYYERIKKR